MAERAISIKKLKKAACLCTFNSWVTTTHTVLIRHSLLTADGQLDGYTCSWMKNAGKLNDAPSGFCCIRRSALLLQHYINVSTSPCYSSCAVLMSLYTLNLSIVVCQEFLYVQGSYVVYWPLVLASSGYDELKS